MAQRITYQGHTITGLREWARSLKVAGRSKMTGWELLAACKQANHDNNKRAEEDLLSKVDIKPGALLAEKCGCVVRVTSEIGGMQIHRGSGVSFVYGQYVTLCHDCKRTHPALDRVLIRGAWQHGPGYRFYLNSMVEVDPRQIGSDGRAPEQLNVAE